MEHLIGMVHIPQHVVQMGSEDADEGLRLFVAAHAESDEHMRHGADGCTALAPAVSLLPTAEAQRCGGGREVPVLLAGCDRVPGCLRRGQLLEVG